VKQPKEIQLDNSTLSSKIDNVVKTPKKVVKTPKKVVKTPKKVVKTPKKVVKTPKKVVKTPKKVVKRLKKQTSKDKQKVRMDRAHAESESEDELSVDIEKIPVSARTKAVMNMINYLKPNQQHKVFFDNWFSSVSLAYILLEKGIHSTATIQIRRVKSNN
jgi:outer membrane biosynthesis protein TonB